MQKILFFATALAGTLSSSTVLMGEPQTRVADIEKIFAPARFSHADDIDVVLHGFFPNSCFEAGSVTFTIDEKDRQIVIDATVLDYGKDRTCAQALVPFVIPVKIGKLDPGEWKVRMLHEPDVATIVPVEENPIQQSPKDPLFAPVSYADISYDEDGDQVVTLRGTYPYSHLGCMVLREVRTYQLPEGVLVVLPIADLWKGDSCDTAVRRFKVSIKLAEPFHGEGLLHVRSFNGQSYYRYIQSPDGLRTM